MLFLTRRGSGSRLCDYHAISRPALVAGNDRCARGAIIDRAVLLGAGVGVMRNVPGGIVVADAFGGSVKCWIEEKGAFRRRPFQPGVRSLIGEMAFANDEAKMPRAVGPHDCVKQDGLALAIGHGIGANLPRRFPLRRIPVRDGAQGR